MKSRRIDLNPKGESMKSETPEGGTACLFCTAEMEIVADNDLAFAIRDKFPVTPYHTLILPKRHVADYFDLSDAEHNAVRTLIMEQKASLEALDPTISGFNVGVNVGRDAGQTIFHVHIHLIPRRRGDTEEPHGGVRGVIPAKQKY
jgi:diadenosine tetraphosphate (Ap4A) HIT family hydrolase